MTTQRTNTSNRTAARPTSPAAVLLALFCAVVASTFAFAVHAADTGIPPADSIITNQAIASYYHTRLAGFETVTSNTTRVKVAPVQGIRLEADLRRLAVQGSTPGLAHRLTNTGNVTSEVSLALANLAGDSFDLANLSLWIDHNGNGVRDGADEVLLADRHIITLAPGETLDLLVIGRVPSHAQDQELAQTQLTASVVGAETSIIEQVTDTITVTTGAALWLDKRANVTHSEPGGEIVYSLRGTNVGNAGLGPIAITVDGQAVRQALIRDAIPAGTCLVAFDNPGVTTPLYHLAGQDQHVYQTTPPADLHDVDAVAFALPVMAAGDSVELAFSVRVNDNGANPVTNTARGLYESLGTPVQADSNRVYTTVPPAPAHLDFMNPELLVLRGFAGRGDTIDLLADAAQCNTNASVVDRYTLIVNGTNAQDLERNFEVVETGPNTGTFTLEEIVTAAWPDNVQLDDNNQVEVSVNDVITARWNSCPGVQLEATILIDPAGIVFDSRNNKPVAGARVILIGINPDGSEYVPEVLDRNLAPVPNEFVTGADGMYEFPLVPQGNYRLMVIPPNGHAFISDFPATLLSPGRRIDLKGSYGQSFPVDLSTGPVFLDIPLDPVGLNGLYLEKAAGRNTAGIGETISYQLKLTNNTGFDLLEVDVNDAPPLGFTYVDGTTTIDGEAVADPTRPDAGTLNWRIRWLQRDTTQIISYRLRVQANALRSDGLNRAHAFNTNAVSNVAEAKVDVDQGVFSDAIHVAGKVFMDCDGNRLQGHEEVGVPGVRLFMQDGTFVVTDAEGKYSIPGLRAVTQVVKLDASTLPMDAILSTLGNRHGGDAGSHFIDAKRGELFRADFAIANCTADVVTQVRARREQGAVRVAEVEQRLGAALQLAPAPRQSDRRGQPASGVLSANGSAGSFKPLATTPSAARRNLLPELGSRLVVGNEAVDLEQLVLDLDSTLAILDLVDGDTVAGNQLSIRVKGAAGTTLRLSVNGTDLGDQRIGQKVVHPGQGVQVWEFVAVRLEAGVNQLRLEQIDPFGNSRGNTSLVVLAPGSLGQLHLDLPTGDPVADGKSSIPVRVRLTDDHGVPVSARTAVTLEASLGVWDETDLDPRAPGLQVFVQNGHGVFALLPPDVPGTANLRVTSGVLEFNTSLDILPNLRPLLVVGVLEAAAGITSADSTSAGIGDAGFEETIAGLQLADAADGDFGARGALFVKGRIRGNRLLTLGWDSDRSSSDRLFRDIRPDEFYPVYGDSAVRGFDAQSTSPLYVRVDQGHSSLLYGDYSTSNNNPARRLGNFQRNLTGLQAHHESGRLALNAFAAYDFNNQVVREFPALGISGPYPLNNSSMVRQSETVEVLIRDRNQPSLVLESRTLRRFVDYSLDFYSGDLILKQPLGSMDANLNPIAIRVTFEAGSNRNRFWLYGTDAQVHVTDWLDLGASEVRDDNPDNPYRLGSINLNMQLGSKDTLLLEYAHSGLASDGNGAAARIEWQHTSKLLTLRGRAVRSSSDFVNPNASVSAGRDEAGLRGNLRLGAKTRLNGELLYSADKLAGSHRRGGSLGLEHLFMDSIRLELGARLVDTTPAVTGTATPQSQTLTSGRLRVGWQPSFLPAANVHAEYEHALSGSQGSRAAVGGEYQVGRRGRLYLNHELQSGLDRDFSQSGQGQRNNATLFGLDMDYMDNGHLFSEYRVRDAINGADAEAAIGLRNGWQLGQGWRLNTSFEQVTPVSGDTAKSLAATGAVEYTGSERWKATSRLEVRRSDSTDSALNTLGVAHKLRRDWALLAQNTLSVRTTRATGQRNIENRLRTGIAWRATDHNRLNALARYELRVQQDDGTGERRTAHIWSGHANWHPSRRLTVTGRYAGKRVTERSHNHKSALIAHLVSGRLTWDLSERWDLSVMASGLASDGLDSHQYAVGAELGAMVHTNVWVSVGITSHAARDQELPGSPDNQGVYARVRFKFDEDMFSWLNP